jgi:hypothetical protein
MMAQGDPPWPVYRNATPLRLVSFAGGGCEATVFQPGDCLAQLQGDPGEQDPPIAVACSARLYRGWDPRRGDPPPPFPCRGDGQAGDDAGDCLVPSDAGQTSFTTSWCAAPGGGAARAPLWPLPPQQQLEWALAAPSAMFPAPPPRLKAWAARPQHRLPERSDCSEGLAAGAPCDVNDGSEDPPTGWCAGNVCERLTSSMLLARPPAPAPC